MGVSYFYLFLGCLFWVFLFPFYFIYLIKMEELETLLNSLVQRGRKPWGVKTNFYWIKQGESLVLDPPYYSRTFRELVSLESGLWQFCIEQKLCRDVEQSRAIHSAQSFATGPSYSSIRDHQYRLLESALIPEEELAQFLLDNIKVAWILN